MAIKTVAEEATTAEVAISLTGNELELVKVLTSLQLLSSVLEVWVNISFSVGFVVVDRC